MEDCREIGSLCAAKVGVLVRESVTRDHYTEH